MKPHATHGLLCPARASTRDSPLQRPVTWMLGNRRACEENRRWQQAAFGPDARAWRTCDESSDARNIGEGDREPDSEGVIAAGVAIVHPRPGSCGRVGRVEVRQMRHLSEKGSVAGLGGGERTNGDTVKSCVSPPTAATPVCAGRPRRSSACAARGRRRGCRPAAKRPRARLPLSPHPGARARRRLCARTPTQTDRSIGKGGEAGGHRQGTLTSSQQAGLSLSPTLTLPLNRRGRP